MILNFGMHPQPLFKKRCVLSTSKIDNNLWVFVNTQGYIYNVCMYILDSFQVNSYN
jgi:hypothetical protein